MIDRDEMVQQVFLKLVQGAIDAAVTQRESFGDNLENADIETYKAAAVRIVSIFWGDEQ